MENFPNIRDVDHAGQTSRSHTSVYACTTYFEICIDSMYQELTSVAKPVADLVEGSAGTGAEPPDLLDCSINVCARSVSKDEQGGGGVNCRLRSWREQYLQTRCNVCKIDRNKYAAC